MTRDDQLAGHTERQTVEVLIDDILLHIEQRLADGNALVELFDGMHMCENGTFGGAVAVIKLEAVRRFNGHQFFARRREVMRIGNVGEQVGVLSADLSGHKCMGNTVFTEIFLDGDKIKTDTLVDDVELTAA